MAISRMQEPRQLYGLGSLVKSIGKGVKKFVKSPLGKAAILGVAGFGVPGTSFGGLFGRGALANIIGQKAMTTAPFAEATGLQAILSKIPGGGYTATAIGSILAASGMDPEEIEATKRDPEKLKIYLKDYYRKTNPDKSEAEVEEFVETNISEYATGGRVGLKDSVKFMTEKELEETMPGLARGEVKNYELKKKANRMENIMKLLREYEKNKKAAGGMPTGIMRTNQAGVMERDYRDEGGFVPVGIKERADDVPAMLSKNEFVMTADAVRGAGDGSIEKGAQRMYDQMKNLESKVA